MKSKIFVMFFLMLFVMATMFIFSVPRRSGPVEKTSVINISYLSDFYWDIYCLYPAGWEFCCTVRFNKDWFIIGKPNLVRVGTWGLPESSLFFFRLFDKCNGVCGFVDFPSISSVVIEGEGTFFLDGEVRDVRILMIKRAMIRKVIK